MHRYAPSKKFILFILALLVLGGVFWILRNNNSNRKQANNNDLKQQYNGPVIAEEIAKDSDGDGLKDWEEALWKTDPNNPDTDGDGTPDGQEIKEGRDPLVPGPDDRLKAPEAGTTTEDGTPSPSLEKFSSATKESLTEAISRQFFNDYLSPAVASPFKAAETGLLKIPDNGGSQNRRGGQVENHIVAYRIVIVCGRYLLLQGCVGRFIIIIPSHIKDMFAKLYEMFIILDQMR